MASNENNYSGGNREESNMQNVEEKLSLLESKVRSLEEALCVGDRAAAAQQEKATRAVGIDQLERSPSESSSSTFTDITMSDDFFPGRVRFHNDTRGGNIYHHERRGCNRCGAHCDNNERNEVFHDDKGMMFSLQKESKSSISTTIIEEDICEEDDYKHLSQDTFSLMLLANAFTKQWLFGLGVFILQIGLLSMIVMDQISSSKDSSPFDVPYKVDPIVHVGQLLAIFLSLTTQTDLVMAVMTFMLLWTERRIYWTKLIKVPVDASLWVWVSRIAFPICCEFVEGACVLFTTFVIVIQSSNIIDLFKDFAAMQLISELDNMMFWLALHGYVGMELATSAKQAIKIKIHDNITKSYGGVPLRTIILLVICMAMICCWGFFVYGQVSGKFFALKYPKCHIHDDDILKLNDGVCDGGYLNTIACGFDDGDCITFNLGYPNCKIDEPIKIGNGICDQEYNDADCLYDGDDCCPLNANDFSESILYGDGKCHGGVFNTEHCEFDGGDCVMANLKYPDCPVLILTNKMLTTFDEDHPFPALGDGRCDGGIFNTKECGWDDGDCLVCNAIVPDPSKVGDGHCDGGLYMDTVECNHDGHDCSFFVKNFPYCHVPEPERLGNGHCDGNLYITEECGFDGGDCSSCNVTYPSWIGDGTCDGGQYLSQGCSMDAGDCAGCLSHDDTDPLKIGDGICNLELNTTECGWDGHDCLESPKLAPCIVEYKEWLGDGFCDGGVYNTAACEYDGGDCLECNALVPDPTKIGDGTCDGGLYNDISVCNEDGKDCRNFNKNYPNCRVHFPEKLGDGFCDGTVYFTSECKNDGGDCDECTVEYDRWVGDGFCDGGAYLSEGCSMDGGDCDLCMQLIPSIDPKRIGDGKCDAALNITECGFDGNDCVDEPVKCNVLIPELLGNGICDGGAYNTPVCNFDNGDCIDCDAIVPYPEKLGDGNCDGGLYMTHPSCFKDGGDCEVFLQLYPNCLVPDPEKVGDGICDGALYFKEECGWDGGDCQSCEADNIEWIGDGICNGGKYLSPACNMDGGDCDICLTATGTDRNNLGDGYCDIELNTTACGHDGSDCIGDEFCSVPLKHWLGDSFCDGGIYNTEICGFDGGDCLACNARVPDPNKIGNGYCDGGLYMTLTECFLDGQDCKEFKKLYPSCIVPEPELVGNGHCDGILYNTTECGWDGNDCIDDSTDSDDYYETDDEDDDDEEEDDDDGG